MCAVLEGDVTGCPINGQPSGLRPIPVTGYDANQAARYRRTHMCAGYTQRSDGGRAPFLRALDAGDLCLHTLVCLFRLGATPKDSTSGDPDKPFA